MKKNFCDGWDNLLWIVAFNLVAILLAAGTFFAFTSLITIPFLSLAILFVAVCLIMIPVSAISDACARIADFKSVPIKEVFMNFRNVIKDAVLFGASVSVLCFVVAVALPFYFDLYFLNGNIMGLFLFAMIFWMLIVTILALQWFMPLRSHFGGGFRKNIKKSFIVFFDNVGFSIFLFIYTLILSVLTPLLAFMAPGITGILLAQNNALRLRLYKYNWLEEHPEIPPKQARKQIPWDELLGDDRETVGPRDLKSFIFPWK
ncbi:MAG: hypothetical protein R3Y36_08065 [Spirochaetales bacterium]